MKYYISIQNQIKQLDSEKYESEEDIAYFLETQLKNSPIFPDIYLLVFDTYNSFYKLNEDFEFEESVLYDKNVLSIFKPVLIPKRIPKKLYHKSNPIFRQQILEQGLKPKVGDSYSCHYNSDNLVPLIFTSTGTDYDSTYDDDLWEINTDGLNKNQFVMDIEYNNALTYLNSIKPENLKLIYKGTGN